MFDQLVTACSQATKPTFVKYAKFLPEIVDGLNILCAGFNFAIQKLHIPFTLQKFTEFSESQKEVFRSQFKLTNELENTNSAEYVILEKSVRSMIWIGVLLIGYLGLGQCLLCNIILISFGFLTIPSDKSAQSKDMSYYWFLMLVSVLVESNSLTWMFLSVVPFYAFIKFCFFYALLTYEAVRTPVVKYTYGRINEFRQNVNPDEIIRKAKQMTTNRTFAKKAM